MTFEGLGDSSLTARMCVCRMACRPELGVHDFTWHIPTSPLNTRSLDRLFFLSVAWQTWHNAVTFSPAHSCLLMATASLS